jgi:hypothetical protein
MSGLVEEWTEFRGNKAQMMYHVQTDERRCASSFHRSTTVRPNAAKKDISIMPSGRIKKNRTETLKGVIFWEEFCELCELGKQ